MKHTSKIVLCALALVLFSQVASALTLNPFKRQGRARANVMLVTGNFLESRVLVELAQYRTKQPIILVSPDGYGKYNIFFMPSGSKPESETAENFVDIIKMVNPKQVICVGNTDFVPASFVDAAQKDFPVIVLNNEDWNVNAQTLGALLDQPKLPGLYADFMKRIWQAQNAAVNAKSEN